MDAKSVQGSIQHRFVWQNNTIHPTQVYQLQLHYKQQHVSAIVTLSAREHVCYAHTIHLPLHCDPPENHPFGYCLHATNVQRQE